MVYVEPDDWQEGALALAKDAISERGIDVDRALGAIHEAETEPEAERRERTAVKEAASWVRALVIAVAVLLFLSFVYYPVLRTMFGVAGGYVADTLIVAALIYYFFGRRLRVIWDAVFTSKYDHLKPPRE